jgi:hypothetical protein
LHGQDGRQAGAADREEHSGREHACARDREKFADQQPLHRQEKMLERQGVRISRKTMGGWLAQVAELLNPLYQSSKKVLFESKAIPPSDGCASLDADARTRRSGEIPRGIQRIFTGRRLLRLRRLFQARARG